MIHETHTNGANGEAGAPLAKTGLSKVGQEIAESGRNAWLAGLGAVASAEQEGRELFDRLVERGKPISERWTEKQKKTLAGAGEKAEKTAREIGRLVTDSVEYEVRGALRRFGFATRDDVKALEARLDSLARELDELTERSPAS